MDNKVQSNNQFCIENSDSVKISYSFNVKEYI